MRQINEFPHYYITVDGGVYSQRRGIILKGGLDADGYHIVALCHEGYQRTKYIHRLVAENFIEKVEGKSCVNHKDGNKLNNNISNLEWNTTQENIEHKRINNLGKTLKAKLSATGINNSQAKLDEEDVIFIRTNCITKNDIKKFSKEFNVSISTIYDIKNRRSWTHI